MGDGWGFLIFIFLGIIGIYINENERAAAGIVAVQILFWNRSIRSWSKRWADSIERESKIQKFYWSSVGFSGRRVDSWGFYNNQQLGYGQQKGLLC